MVVTTEEGARRMVELVVNKTTGEDLVLFLFTNPVTPTPATKLEDLKELAGGGYQARTLTGSKWTVDKEGKKTVAT